MTGELDAAAAGQRRSLDHVDAGPVVALHVAVARGEVLRLPTTQIACDGQGLEEHFGHDDGAAQVQDEAAVIERGKGPGESLEVAVARSAEYRAVGRRVLVNDFGADGGVH